MKPSTSVRLILPIVAALGLAACGTNTGDRAVSLGSLGAGAVFGEPDKFNGPVPLPPHGPIFPGPVPPPALKCTPAPCALPNVDASAGTTMPVNETPIAVNPIDRRQLITGSNDYNCNTRFLGFWTSGDGGKKWSGGCVQSLQGTALAGDPVLGYDLNGTVYQGGVNLISNNGVVAIASSTDNGRTWNTPVAAVDIGNLSADKPWLAIDTNPGSPNKNNLYISNTMYGLRGTTIYVTTSKDGGQTWNSVAASAQAQFPSLYQFSDLATGSDGTVYLTYFGCTEVGKNSDCGGTVATMYFQKSTDAGNTWSAPVVIDTPTLAPACGSPHSYVGCIPNTEEPVTNIPVIGIDNSTGRHNGNLYCVDYNWTGSYMLVQVRRSRDGGSTWSAPVPVAPDTDTHDQFFPWLSVASDGKVGVTWMDRRNDPANISYEAFGTWSGDGGTTFNANNVQIAQKPSNPNNDGFGGIWLADYTGNAWIGTKKLIASWMDTGNGSYAQDYIGGLER